MAKDYRVFAHLEVLDSLPKSGKRRAAVIQFLQILGQVAHLGGDYERDDPDLDRTVSVSEISGFAITWWIDEPVLEVKVVDIKLAANKG